MPEIIVRFNKTTNSAYTSYGKIEYDISYADNISARTTTATINTKFYIKPDSYTYTQYTSDSLYLGIRKGSANATLEKVVINPTLTSGKEVKSNVYNHIGSATFTVTYNSTSQYYVYLAVGYNNANTSRFAPFYIPQSDGSAYNSYTYTSGGSNIVALAQRISYTACTAPTSFTANSTNFYSSVNLAWSGAVSGIANAIASYDIQYRTSINNVSWSNWSSLTKTYTTATSGAYLTTPNISSGTYIQYQIRACGTAGSGFYSSWVQSSVVRKSSVPTVVPYVNLNKTDYSQGDSITLAWGRSNDTDNDISYYKIEYSKNNATWVSLTTVNALTYTFIPNIIGDEEFVKFRIFAVDSKGNVGGYKESAVLYRRDYSGVKLCKNGAYSKVTILVCKNGVYKKAQVYICKNGTYVKGVN